MLNVRQDARWDLVQATLERYFSETPVVIGGSLKRHHHFSENFKVRGFTPDYQPRRPKLRQLSRMSMRRFQYAPQGMKLIHRRGNLGYYQTEWNAVMWVKHHKRFHKARRHASRFSLFALDMAGVVCAPFPPGFFGDNPATATSLLGDAAVGILKLTSTAEERRNMADCEDEAKRLALLHDKMGSFLRVRALGAVRRSESEPGKWRTYNLGLLEVCHMMLPFTGLSSAWKSDDPYYADPNSFTLPRRTYQIEFLNRWNVESGGTIDEVFSHERLVQHNTWWHADSPARQHAL